MNELDKALAKLAEKLGTSVEHLWAVLIRQAKIEVVNDVVFIVINAALIYALFRVWQWRKKVEESGDDFFSTLIAVFGSVGVAIMTGFSIALLLEIPTLLLNPEYWALKEIVGTAGK